MTFFHLFPGTFLKLPKAAEAEPAGNQRNKMWGRGDVPDFAPFRVQAQFCWGGVPTASAGVGSSPEARVPGPWLFGAQARGGLGGHVLDKGLYRTTPGRTAEAGGAPVGDSTARLGRCGHPKHRGRLAGADAWPPRAPRTQAPREEVRR